MIKNSKRRKKPIDGIDRDILRFLFKGKRHSSGATIAKRVNLSPPAIKPRLINLQNKGIIKPFKIGSQRKITRSFGKSKKIRTIFAPSKIQWGLDLRI